MQICNLLGYDEFGNGWNENTEYICIRLTFGNTGVMNSNAAYLKQFEDKEIIGAINLNLGRLYRDGALTHELTHLICGETSFMSLQEGICQYVQERIGDSSTVKYYNELGIDLKEQELLRLAYDSSTQRLLAAGIICKADIEQLWEDIGKVGYYSYSPSEIKGTLWYKLSLSFASWLIDEYGMENVIAIMETGTDENAYEIYMGKSLEDLKTEWKEWFMNVKTSMTVEEFEKIGD